MLDIQTYYTNLTKANEDVQDTPPSFVRLYDPIADYGMDSLFPEDYHKLSQRLATDNDLFIRYYMVYTI